MYVVSVGVGGGSLVQGSHVMAFPRIPEVRPEGKRSQLQAGTRSYRVIRGGRGEKDPWCVCCVLTIISAQNTARPSPELPLNPSHRKGPSQQRHPEKNNVMLPSAGAAARPGNGDKGPLAFVPDLPQDLRQIW